MVRLAGHAEPSPLPPAVPQTLPKARTRAEDTAVHPATGSTQQVSADTDNSADRSDSPNAGVDSEGTDTVRSALPRASRTSMMVSVGSVSENSHKYIRKTSIYHRRRLMKGEKHPFPCLVKLVRSSCFEWAVGTLIIFNCVAIGWQAEQRQVSGTVEVINTVLEHFFTAAFALELLLRVLVYGWTILLESENYLDMFLVTLSVIVTWVLGPLEVRVDFLRKLTVLRTLRLVRLAAAVRLRPEFKDMWALLHGVRESGETLFWTYIMIGCVLYFFAIMATSLIGKRSAFQDNETAQEYFGDVPRSMLSLFQVMTLDSYSGIVRELMEIEAWTCFYFVVYISVAVFVLMNLVTAIIVDNAFCASKADEEERAKRVEHEKEKELEALKDFFVELDKDNSGKLSQYEFHEAMQNRKVKQKLRAWDLLPKDMAEVWEILDNGDGELDVGEFINGVRRLQGDAKAKDILQLQKEMRTLESSLDTIEATMKASKVRMQNVDFSLQRTRSDIAAVHRTLGRAKDAVKLAARTQAAQ